MSPIAVLRLRILEIKRQDTKGLKKTAGLGGHTTDTRRQVRPQTPRNVCIYWVQVRRRVVSEVILRTVIGSRHSREQARGPPPLGHLG